MAAIKNGDAVMGLALLKLARRKPGKRGAKIIKQEGDVPVLLKKKSS